jgi:hypothetical protein
VTKKKGTVSELGKRRESRGVNEKYQIEIPDRDIE